MADDIIIFPEFDKIKNEIERLRIELSMLLLERDELQFVICRNIEAKYTLEFGSIEYRAYEAQCTALRLKRKIDSGKKKSAGTGQYCSNRRNT